ncbi:MAG TPA: diaminopimelate epimerase [Candidatus Limnocylindria bacterium]|nr:diaminopimelate epimerase [Candidatus Limnocylindria bacterium]
MTTSIPIIKTNGTGNDFVLVDERETPLDDPVAFARRVCDRASGVGADGVLLVERSERFDARMRIINADGSEAEMCGNGMRCFARYLDEHDGIGEATVETLAGPIGTRVLSRAPYTIAVEVGEPKLGEPHEVAGYRAVPVDVGNPHVVIQVDDVDAIDLAVIGPRIERDPRYPHGTNVHFVERMFRHAQHDGGARHDTVEWKVRHWERGAGATQACGTGTVATAAVLIASGEATSPVALRVPGGVLEVVWTPGTRATLIGDAVREYERVIA